VLKRGVEFCLLAAALMSGLACSGVGASPSVPTQVASSKSSVPETQVSSIGIDAASFDEVEILGVDFEALVVVPATGLRCSTVLRARQATSSDEISRDWQPPMWEQTRDATA